ncbi:methyl-accepting chemotaxis protein, partial [Pseudomonas syringae pv. tagetis]
MAALRNHLEAVLLLDAVRGVVLSAMLVGVGKRYRTRDEVQKTIYQHDAKFLAVSGENSKLP